MISPSLVGWFIGDHDGDPKWAYFIIAFLSGMNFIYFLLRFFIAPLVLFLLFFKSPKEENLEADNQDSVFNIRMPEKVKHPTYLL